MRIEPIKISEASNEESAEERLHRCWQVILYNDEEHDFEEVIFQVQKAIGCSMEHAIFLTWETHTEGMSVVFTGEIDECLRVESILREIDLHTEIWG